jgi:hypothetical protein
MGAAHAPPCAPKRKSPTCGPRTLAARRRARATASKSMSTCRGHALVDTDTTIEVHGLRQAGSGIRLLRGPRAEGALPSTITTARAVRGSGGTTAQGLTRCDAPRRDTLATLKLLGSHTPAGPRPGRRCGSARLFCGHATVAAAIRARAPCSTRVIARITGDTRPVRRCTGDAHPP